MQDRAESPYQTSAKLYLILTASNEIYDDFGEKISTEKMAKAAEARHEQVAEYLPTQNENDVIAHYRKTPEARLTSVATLVNLTRSKGAATFFVNSFRHFLVDIDEEPLNLSTPGEGAAGCCSIL